MRSLLSFRCNMQLFIRNRVDAFCTFSITHVSHYESPIYVFLALLLFILFVFLNSHGMKVDTNDLRLKF